MTTCKAWIPTDSGSRYCGEPATRRLTTFRSLSAIPMCTNCYEQWREAMP